MAIEIYIWLYIAGDAQPILATCWLIPSQTLCNRRKRDLPPFPELAFCMMSYGLEYIFGQFKSAVLILSPTSSLPPLPLVGQ